VKYSKRPWFAFSEFNDLIDDTFSEIHIHKQVPAGKAGNCSLNDVRSMCSCYRNARVRGFIAKAFDIAACKVYNECELRKACSLKKVGTLPMNINYENNIYTIDRDFRLAEFDKAVEKIHMGISAGGLCCSGIMNRFVPCAYCSITDCLT